MGLFRRGLKDKELKRISLLNEKWIFPQFIFPFPNSLARNLGEPWISDAKSGPSNTTRIIPEEVIMGYILPLMLPLSNYKKLSCFVDTDFEPPLAILKFPDLTSAEKKLKGIRVVLKPQPKSIPTQLPWFRHVPDPTYWFTPLEVIEYREVIHRIESILLALFGMEKLQTRKDLIFFYYADDGSPWVGRSDNISYFSFPFEKRVELFLESKRADEKMAKELFGEKFPILVKFIMEKKQDDEFMRAYCSKVQDILERYDVDV